MKLTLPEGATLELRLPRGSALYRPMRIRFADGTTTSHVFEVFKAVGVEVLDWTDPKITDLPLE